ncbi:MAG: hypothetical protein GY795_13840 [Desulfobacterales bacterium]|nr:hypothetical protein [Desulfobacterales bacterium]
MVIRISVFILLCVFLNSGCSVYMATKQPEKKNLSVLNPGTPRAHVIAELGSPVYTEVKNGVRSDIFSFIQGYSKGAKTGRALFHGVADVLTLGIWEAVGTPVEGIADGKEVRVQVIYGRNDLVREIKPLKGLKIIVK